MPLLGAKRVSEIDAGDIERFFADVTAGKTARDDKIGPRRRIIVRGGAGRGSQVFRDLSAVVNLARRREIIARNPCDIAAVQKTDCRNERYLTLAEVGRLCAALDALEREGVNPKGLNIARLWALTGCRRNEIAGLKWSEVDLIAGILKFSDSKTGKSVRPLGAAAIALLQSLEKQDRVTNEIAAALSGFSTVGNAPDANTRLLQLIAERYTTDGALTRPGGCLRIAWRCEAFPDADGQSLRVDWFETSAIAPVKSDRRGFGRDLIEVILPYELDAETEFAMTANGVRCRIVLPLPTAAEARE